MSNSSAYSNRFVALLIPFALGLALCLLLLPGLASATASDYLVSHGLLRVDMAQTTANGRTRGVRTNIAINGGQFTYDAATGALSQLTVTSGGSEINLAPPGNSSGLVGVNQFGNNSRILLIGTGISMPGGLFAGAPVNNIRIMLLGSAVQASPVVPISPGPAVPEPAAALLFGGGLLAAGWGVRQRVPAREARL